MLIQSLLIKRHCKCWRRNSLNYVTEEMKNPSVNLPRAIILGLTIVTCCFLAVNVAYMSVLSFETIIHSDAVAVVRDNKGLIKK